MRSLFIILFSFLFILGNSQDPGPPKGYIPIKGYPYFLKDAKERIIQTDVAGVFSTLTADTTSEWLVQPPDTFQLFIISEGNPGDTSALSNGVQAYWSFEETSGSTAYDSAGSYNGTLMNTPTLMQTGISNYCYLFTSDNDEWIDLGTSFGNFGLSDFTISFWWYNIYDTNPGGVIGNSGSDPNWSIRASSGQVQAIIWLDATEYKIISNSSIPDNAWHYGVFRVDRSGNTTLHIDNVLQTEVKDISSKSAINLTNANTAAIGRIGNHAANYYHNGRIDEILAADRLWTVEEISNSYNNSVGKFWPYGEAGGDSLNMLISEYDVRADTFRILSKHESYSANRTDGDLEFAFGIADIEDYIDTTFAKAGPKDTTEYWTAFSGLIPEDIWTGTPNKDTVFRDSSSLTPPIQDPSGWDTIFHQDFEHQSAPIEYTSGRGTSPLPDLFSSDWNGTEWRDSDHRWPGWWSGQVPDSILIDPLTSSKVMKYSFLDAFVDGYGGNTVRGGDFWRMWLWADPEPTEVYLSYNLQFRPNFDWHQGGKIPGVNGGSPYDQIGLTKPEYGEGFGCVPMFHHTPQGSLIFYFYHQNGPAHYADVEYWNEFAPVGDGLQYTIDESTGRDMFIFDVTSPTWYNITIRYVTNSFTGGVPNYDGIFEGYVNGYLIERLSGLYLLTVPDINKGVNEMAFGHFFGGGTICCSPQRDEWTYIDDVIMFTYDESVDVPRGNEVSPPGRILNLPNWPKQ